MLVNEHRVGAELLTALVELVCAVLAAHDSQSVQRRHLGVSSITSPGVDGHLEVPRQLAAAESMPWCS